MDAEFFCINTHMDAAGQLVHNLNKFVDPTIALKVLNADTEAWSEREETGRRYTKLLHASIPPERELTIEAVTRLELFGNRIYLRIYWPMLVEGYYWYPGVSEMVKGMYWNIYERQFHAGGLGLEQFLPALAIRDWMVLVPKGQNETLESMGPNELARPPLQRGIIEVDFEDPMEMERAFVTIGKELRKELRHELLAYQSFHVSDQSDFDTVSAHLGVPPSLLRTCTSRGGRRQGTHLQTTPMHAGSDHHRQGRPDTPVPSDRQSVPGRPGPAARAGEGSEQRS